VEAARIEHLKMIQGVINRLATCSFQLKGWVVTLAAALQVFLKEANPAYLFVPALPVIAFWFLDGWYLRQERLFRRLYDDVCRRKEGAVDFSMDTRPFRKAVGSVIQVAFSRIILLFYGPVLIVLLLLESLLLHKAR
jgi:hypothetical protein